MMNTEFEIKFLKYDEKKLRNFLIDNGAELMQKRTLMKRSVFDTASTWEETKDKFEWIRLRDEGNKTTLTYKYIDRSRGAEAMDEVEVEVSDFEKTNELLERVGLNKRAFQETYRESWKFGDYNIEFDEWPHVDPFIEIEGPSEDKLKEFTQKLGFNWEDGLFGNIDPIYQYYYGEEAGFKIPSLPELSFDKPLPEEFQRIK